MLNFPPSLALKEHSRSSDAGQEPSHEIFRGGDGNQRRQTGSSGEPLSAVGDALGWWGIWKYSGTLYHLHCQVEKYLETVKHWHNHDQDSLDSPLRTMSERL